MKTWFIIPLLLLLTKIPFTNFSSSSTVNFEAVTKIILLNGDTVQGFSSIRKDWTKENFSETRLSERIEFTKENEKKKVIYRPGEIKGFIVATHEGDNVLFYSTKNFENFKAPKGYINDDRYAFVQQLYQGGKAGVYRNYFHSYNGVEASYEELDYLVKNYTEVLYGTNHFIKDWEKKIITSLADCPTLTKKIKERVYKQADYLKIAIEYNNCN